MIEWIDIQPPETPFLSAATVAELHAGVVLLPAGKRRAGLQENRDKRGLPRFAGRVLPINITCAQTYAELTATTRDAGLAIATASGLAVASRDTGPFEAAGAVVINPWQA